MCQLGLLFPIYGKVKNVPNHQPAMGFPWFSHGFLDGPPRFSAPRGAAAGDGAGGTGGDAPGFNSNDTTHGHALFTYMTGPLFWVNVGKKVGKKVGPLFCTKYSYICWAISCWVKIVGKYSSSMEHLGEP